MLAGLHGGILFSLLLGKPKTSAARFLIHKNLYCKFLLVPVFLHLHQVKPDVFVVALRPLNNLAFIVEIGLHHNVEVEMRLDEFVDNEFLTPQVALVKIDGTDDGLEGIAEYNALELNILLIKLDDEVDTNLSGEEIKGVPVDNPGPDFCEKALILERVLLEKIVGYGGAKDGITEVLQPFIGFAEAVDLLGSAGVENGELVKGQVRRGVACDGLDRGDQFPLFFFGLAAWEFQ